MKIAGLQKFSLIDYPGKVAAVLFTQGCNFRCPYCHNPELVLPELFQSIIPTEIVLSFLRERVGQLEAVVISGGEPTLQTGLIDFILAIKKLGYSVKLDTNGSNPNLLRELIALEIVDFFAMDIKAPFEKYAELAGCEVDVARLKESIALIIASGLNHEFRTTFDESRLTIYDIDAIQDSLPTDKYYDQECLIRPEKPVLASYLKTEDEVDSAIFA